MLIVSFNPTRASSLRTRGRPKKTRQSFAVSSHHDYSLCWGIPDPEGPKPGPTPPNTPVPVDGVVVYGVVLPGVLVVGVVVDGVVVGVVVPGVPVTGVVGEVVVVPEVLINAQKQDIHKEVSLRNANK